MKKLFAIGLILILMSCNVRRITRNPVFRTKCPVHGEKLIKAKVSNEFGAYCSIKFNRKHTPYPKVGICTGTPGPPYESKIKYCPSCGNGH